MIIKLNGTMNYDIVTRHPQNPLLTAAQLSDLPGGCNSVFNSAVFRYGEGYKAILASNSAAGCRVCASRTPRTA